MLIGIEASRLAKKEKTGVEWYAYHLLRAMRELPRTHSVRLYTRDPLPFSLPNTWTAKKIFWPLPLLWTQGGLSLEMLFHAPDLLFVPSSALPVIIPRTTVTTIHDVGFLQEHSYRSAQELFYLDWSTRYAVRHATKIITVSEFTKRELIRLYGAAEEKVAVIHLAHDPSPPYFDHERQEVLNTHHLNRPYLVFISRIDSRKNVGALIKAFRILKNRGLFDGDLVLIGPLGFDGAQIIHDGARGAFHQNIRHLGWISEREKNIVLQGATAFVFPSLYEGFGMVILEAQSSGTPVLCSSTTSLPEVAGNGALTVDPSVTDSIADGMARIVSDGALRASLKERGLLNCARFSWQKTAEKTMTVFDEALRRGH